MLEISRQELRKESSILILFSVVCISLSIVRIILSETISYLFLNWNLFLAAIPWLFSSLLVLFPTLQKRKLALIVVVLSWLLFFPNAPYILTDLYHLRHVFSMPVWFDLMLILFFAWTGILYGYLSLLNIEKVLVKYLSKKLLNCAIPLLFLLVGFGIYIGRYLRWNSWDIIRNPLPIIQDIQARVLHPLEHAETWGLTLIMGLFLFLIYTSFKLFLSKSE